VYIVFAFASAVFAGATSILAKIGIKNVDSTLATALRTIVVVIFAWLMVFVVGSQNTISSISARSLIFLVLSGLATGASWLCYFRALQIGSVNKVVPVDKASTVLTMVLAIIFLSESFTWLTIVCIVVILAGTYAMIEKQAVTSETPDGKGWFIYAAGSAIFASLTAILGKVGIENVESNLGTAIRTVIVLVMAWLIVVVQGKAKQATKVSRHDWVFLILSGIATGLSWLCFFHALQIGPASVVVPIDKLSIVVTIVFSRLALGEKLTRRSALGLAGIVAGTLLLLVRLG
jgi:transporter family protein